MTVAEAPPSITGRPSLRRLILVLPIALILVWLIARQAVDLLLVSSPTLPIQPLWPVSGRALIAKADVRSAAANKSDPATAARLQQVVLDDPLAPDPFYAAALSRIQAGDRATAIGLLEQARRREPRWVAPRLLLAQQYAVAGKVEGAVREIGDLTRLDSDLGSRLSEALEPLGRDPRTRGVLIAALRRDVRLREVFVEYATRKGGDAGLLFSSLVAGPESQGAANQQAAVVGMLVANADYQRAYLAWINFLPKDALAGIAFIYDGNFSGLPGPLPFNWRLFNDGSGNAELTRKTSLPQGTALEANYFSEQPANLAEQVMVLEPGSYVFSYSVTGQRDGDSGGSLGWSLHCLDKQGGELLRSSQMPSRATRVDVRFTVPAAACAAQKLSLLGTSSDVPATLRAEYSGLMVRRDAGAATTTAADGQGGTS